MGSHARGLPSADPDDGSVDALMCELRQAGRQNIMSISVSAAAAAAGRQESACPRPHDCVRSNVLAEVKLVSRLPYRTRMHTHARQQAAPSSQGQQLHRRSDLPAASLRPTLSQSGWKFMFATTSSPSPSSPIDTWMVSAGRTVHTAVSTSGMETTSRPRKLSHTSLGSTDA
jgi:hypothetical protein